MTLRSINPVVLCAVAMAASSAAAQISYVSQQRVVRSQGGVGTGLGAPNIDDVGTTVPEMTNSGLGAWEAFTDWGQEATDNDGNVLGSFREQAQQTSNLADDRITASGYTTVSIGNQGSGRGVSTVDVTFVIADDIGYQLDMSMTQNYYRSISLIGPGLNILWDPNNDGQFNRTLSQSGQLSAGEYQLQIMTWGEDGLPNASYDFSLVVPAPASAALLGLGGLAMTRRRR